MKLGLSNWSKNIVVSRKYSINHFDSRLQKDHNKGNKTLKFLESIGLDPGKKYLETK